MSIELDRETQARAVASIERYWLENFDQKVGNVQAAALLHFFLEEIAPCVYNRAVSAVQERLLQRVAEVDIDCHEDEFGHWTRRPKR